MAYIRNPRSSKLQFVANLLTILVAVAAILLSIWEGRENRRHNRLSVMPHLERIETTSREGPLDSTYSIHFALFNSGLGPAVLRDVLVFRNDSLQFQSQPNDDYYPFSSFQDDLQGLKFNGNFQSYTYSRRSGELLQAGKEHLVFDLAIPVQVDGIEGSTTRYIRQEMLNNYSFVFCYCSVYNDQCDTVYLSTPPPEQFVCEF